MPSPLLRRVLRIVQAVVDARGAGRRPSSSDGTARPPRRPDRPGRPGPATAPRSAAGAYPGDFTGTLRPTYAPDLDGHADPGEIVWAWVPFEEGDGRGKDRPVLVVGRDGAWLLGLMLTSRDHDVRPGRPGEVWLDLGAGDWDARGRPSEVRLDRVVRLDPATVRREGAVLDQARFDRVVAALAR